MAKENTKPNTEFPKGLMARAMEEAIKADGLDFPTLFEMYQAEKRDEADFSEAQEDARLGESIAQKVNPKK